MCLKRLPRVGKPLPRVCTSNNGSGSSGELKGGGGGPGRSMSIGSLGVSAMRTGDSERNSGSPSLWLST
ncbi:hypothetical protein D3C80_2032140 [compost metagenome]